jgi:hypothetical protein
MGCYPHFILPMRSSRGFASTTPNSSSPFRTRFRFGSAPQALNLAGDRKSPDHYAKGTPSGSAHPKVGIALRPLVGVWFQVQCPPLVGVLPIFRSRYWYAIGRHGVLSLAGWAPQIRAHFHVLGPTQVPARSLSSSRTGLSPAVVELSRSVPLEYSTSNCRSYNPGRACPAGLGWSAFARRY